MTQDFRRSCQFPTTHWSVVARARGDAMAQRRAALTELITRYSGPLKAHLVARRRIQIDRADDLLQGFLLSRILESNLLGRAERTKGRFRGFLVSALDRYVSNEARDARTKKRSPDHMANIDDCPPPVDDTAQPHRQFVTAWAREVMAQSLRQMQRWCEDRPALWGIFEARVLAPLLDGVEPIGNDELARRFALESPGHVSNILVTGKRMFARALRSVVGEYEKDPKLIDAEIDDLRVALAQNGK